MRKIKKMTALLLTFAMVFAMAVTVFAEEANSQQFTLTLDTTKTVKKHSYKVYQLFTGDYTGYIESGKGTTESVGKYYKDSNGAYVEIKADTETSLYVDKTVYTKEDVLANLKYGNSGFTGTTETASAGDPVSDDEIAAIGKTAASSETYAQAVVDSGELTTVYASLSYDTDDDGNATADSVTSVTVPAGYYLIVDDTSKTIAAGDTFSKYIVKVVKDETLTPKSESVTSDKKEYNDDVELTTHNETGVGSAVSYRLTGKIAADASVYDYYNFVMCDTLSDGLTFNDDIAVTIGGTAATATGDNPDYVLYKNEDGYTFEVALLDAKNHAGQEVVITYSATLNSNAVAMEAETNDFNIKYSNAPEQKYSGEQNPDRKGMPLDITKPIFGQTPVVRTYTYDTKIQITKQDEDGKKLSGATFELKSTDANQTIVNTKEYYQLDNTTADADAWYLLKDGTYTQTAPTADEEYVEIGTGDANTTKGYIKNASGEYVVPSDVKDYKGKTLYAKQLTSGSDYASTDKYKKLTASATASVAAPVDMILTSGSDGLITFDGLGTGSYTLTEVDAPDGYNYANEITFDIEFGPKLADDGTEVKDANGDTVYTFTVTNVNNATISATDGILTTTVTDKAGTVLPTTGGMGTTLFYIVGIILVIAAVVILVARKRIEK